MQRSHIAYYCILISLIVFSTFSSAALGGTFYEDFSTKQYCDTLATTAWWDTAAGELKHYPYVPRLAGDYNTSGLSYDIAVDGNYAYVADGTNGLVVIDISDPEAPFLAGSYDTPGSALGVTVEGDYAFVADGTSGIQVIDISDPTSPGYAGGVDTPGSAHCVAVSGDYAFVADWDSGLRVIDISDPALPVIVGGKQTLGDVRDVAIDGDYAYLACLAAGLQVIDISNPMAPDSAGSFSTIDLAYAVAVDGDHVFMAVYAAGLEVIDISDPTMPAPRGIVDTPGPAVGITVDGDYAYLADGGSGLQVIDIYDPSIPSLLYDYDTSGLAYDVVIDGDYAFVADYTFGLQIFEIRETDRYLNAGYCYTPGEAWGIAVAGNYAFIADNYSGLQVLDIRDPTSPWVLGGYDTSGQAVGIAVAGDYVYLVVRTEGLLVFDISDPTNPSLIGSYGPLGYFEDVALSGDYAYFASGTEGLAVIDISDPTHPSLVGRCDTLASYYDVDVAGDYAFIVKYHELVTVDISDPMNPAIAGSCAIPGTGQNVVVRGNYAFVVDQDGFRTINISDPTSPVLEGNYETSASAVGLEVNGDYAYVTNWGSAGPRFLVFDISDPANPVSVDSLMTPGNAQSFDVAGDYVFVAARNGGLAVVLRHTRSRVAQSFCFQDVIDHYKGIVLYTTQTGTIRWEVSIDGGSSWEEVNPGYSGHAFSDYGFGGLYWRSTLLYEPRGVDPVCDNLNIEWLYTHAVIDSIVDVPNDQGGWVRVYFTRSGFDMYDEATSPIIAYSVYRWFDDPQLLAGILDSGIPIHTRSADYTIKDELSLSLPSSIDQMQLFVLGNRYFYVPEAADNSTLTGGYEVVQTVIATRYHQYVCLAPTQEDSNPTTFRILAHTITPIYYWYSDPDTGSSYDNIAPAVPEGFTIAYNTGSGNELSWDLCPDEDFQYFRIYRSEDEDFDPAPGNLIHATIETNWLDTVDDGWKYHYKITALDYAGNESGAASPDEVSGRDIPLIPVAFRLYQNVPNPFNPATVIRFDLPMATHVKLYIYNVKGERIATVVDQHMTEGRKEVSWIAVDDSGRSIASGIYFYRLVAGNFVQTRKMVLLR